LIYIETTAGEATQALQLATGRIRRLVRLSDRVLLLEQACALLLPATPFSGAQALARRLSTLLADLHCVLQVYHGATALLILQHLHKAGARTLPCEESVEIPSPSRQVEKQADQEEWRLHPSSTLPYLAFLTNYPSLQLLNLFPYELACRYQCVPLGSERNMLTLGTDHRLNREIITQLHTATRRGIFQVRCEVSVIDEVLRYWRHLQESPGTHDDGELAKDEAYITGLEIGG
jgi:hypothetical protein